MSSGEALQNAGIFGRAASGYEKTPSFRGFVPDLARWGTSIIDENTCARYWAELSEPGVVD